MTGKIEGCCRSFIDICPKLLSFLFIIIVLILLLTGLGSASSFESQTQNLYLVTKVIDGDTIQLSNGEKVRYIGIDTPETKHPKKVVEYFGEEAYNVNKGLVEGKKVRLEFDIQQRDRYGRLLAYVYYKNPNLKDETFINAYLVKNGYARVATYPPNVRYQVLFLGFEKDARLMKRGLWSPPEKDLEVRITNFSEPIMSSSLDNNANNSCIAFRANRYVTWEIQIIDKNQNVLKEWFVARTKSSDDIQWDYRDDRGNFLSSGKYVCRVIGIDDLGNRAEDTYPILIDRQKPGFIDRPKVFPEKISSANQSSILTFSPDEDVSVVVLAMDGSGKRRVYVDSVLGSLYLSKGENMSVTWESFEGLPNGKYNFQIAMTDKSGNYVENNSLVLVEIPNNPVTERHYEDY
jgi:micrococcal nuclease